MTTRSLALSQQSIQSPHRYMGLIGNHVRCKHMWQHNNLRDKYWCVCTHPIHIYYYVTYINTIRLKEKVTSLFLLSKFIFNPKDMSTSKNKTILQPNYNRISCVMHSVLWKCNSRLFVPGAEDTAFHSAVTKVLWIQNPNLPNSSNFSLLNSATSTFSVEQNDLEGSGLHIHRHREQTLIWFPSSCQGGKKCRHTHTQLGFGWRVWSSVCPCLLFGRGR